MKYSEFTIARADTGAVLPYARVTVTLNGSAAALFNSSGGPISNPVTGDVNGKVGFATANGTYVLNAVSAGGDYTVPAITVQIFDLQAVANALAAGTVAGMVSKTKATQALLYADLAATDGSLGLVYADGTAINNDLYVKIGASGSGSWSSPTGLFVSAAAAAAISATSAQADAATVAANLAGLKAIQTPLAVTFDRYLDTVTGNDANNGLTANTPKLTMDAVLGMGSITAGVAIGIARGSKISNFSTGNTLTGDNIRVGSYGALSSSPPAFDPSILLLSSGWAADGTYTGMYNQSVGGGYVDAALKNIGNVVWLNQATGKYMVLKQYATKAALSAAASGVYVSGWNTTTLTVSLKPGTYGNPATSAQEYRVTNNNGLRIYGNYAVVSDLELRNAAEQNGCLDLGSGVYTAPVARRVKCLNGSRHNSLLGKNSTVEDSYFAGGDDQLEAASANGIVFFTADWNGGTFTSRRNTFENNDGNNMLPIYSHDATNTGPMLPCLSEDDIFIATYNVGEVGVIGAHFNIVRPTFKDNSYGTCYYISTTDMTCSFPKGRINMISDGLGDSRTTQVLDADLYVPNMGGGSRQSLFIYSGSGAGAAVIVNRGTYLINPAITGYSGHNLAPFVLNKGSLYVQGATFKLDAQFHAGTMTHGWDLGYLGGVFGTVTGGANSWPYGIKFARNGTTYNTLALAQAAGYETGSASQAIPTATAATDFSAIANGNLEGVTGWTKVRGPTGGFTVTSNKVAFVTGATTAYKRGDIPAAGGYIRFKVEVLRGNVGAAQRISPTGDYYLQTYVNSDGKIYVEYLTPTVNNFMVYGQGAASVGDMITSVTKITNAATGEITIWVYVNDALQATGVYADLGLAAQTGVGCAGLYYAGSGAVFSAFSAGALA